MELERWQFICTLLQQFKSQSVVLVDFYKCNIISLTI
jgi:hypothetical protein